MKLKTKDKQINKALKLIKKAILDEDNDEALYCASNILSAVSNRRMIKNEKHNKEADPLGW